MAVGDEAGGGSFGGNVSDDEGHISRNLNASPTTYEDSPIQNLDHQKFINKSIDNTIALQTNGNIKQNEQEQDEEENENDTDDVQYGSYNYQNTLKTNNSTYMRNNSIDDVISKSNFGSIIQNWLHDSVAIQSHRYYHDRPWSKCSRPWTLEKIQRDIDRHYRYNEYEKAIEIAKKMLQNGILGKE